MFFCLPVSLVKSRSSTRCVSEAQKESKVREICSRLSNYDGQMGTAIYCGTTVISTFLESVRFRAHSRHYADTFGSPFVRASYPRPHRTILPLRPQCRPFIAVQFPRMAHFQGACKGEDKSICQIRRTLPAFLHVGLDLHLDLARGGHEEFNPAQFCNQFDIVNNHAGLFLEPLAGLPPQFVPQPHELLAWTVVKPSGYRLVKFGELREGFG